MVSNSLPTGFANVNQLLAFSEPRADFLPADDEGEGGFTDGLQGSSSCRGLRFPYSTFTTDSV